MISIRFAIVTQNVRDAMDVFNIVNLRNEFEFVGMADNAEALSKALYQNKADVVLALGDKEGNEALCDVKGALLIMPDKEVPGSISVTAFDTRLKFAQVCTDYSELFDLLAKFFRELNIRIPLFRDIELKTLFAEIGIPGHLNGGIYLAEILKIATDEYGLPDKLKKTVIPKVAQKFNKTVHSIERSAVFAIERAYNSKELYNINSITGQKLLPDGYKPGLKEFVFLMIDVARMVGVEVNG